MQKNFSTDTSAMDDNARPLDRRYLQQLRWQQTDTAFKIADGLKASGSDGIALFRQVGISEADLEAYLKMPGILGPFRAQLQSRRVPFDTMKALIKADDEMRNEALRKILSGVRLSAEDVATAHQFREERQKSELEELQVKAQEKLRDRFESRIPDGARALHRAMVVFESELDRSRALTRQSVIDLAARLLADFEFIYGHDWAPVEDWLLVGLTDGVRQKLSEAHFALRELASGKFENALPAIHPYKFRGPDRFLGSQIPPWSALSAIQFLTGEPSRVSTGDRYGVRPVRRLTAIEICAGIGGQAMGLSSAGFKIKGAFDHDPAAVEVLQANRPWWNPKCVDLQCDEGELFDLIEKSLTSATGEVAKLDLLSGAIPWRIWAAGSSKAAKKEANLLPTVESIVRRFTPSAFLLEMVKNFTCHTTEWNRFVSTYTELGYHVEVYTPTYADFGILEERDKIFVIGLQQTSAKNFVLPALSTPFRRDLVSTIWDLEFRHWSAYSRVPVGEDERSQDQRRLDRWCSDWVHSYRKVNLVPPFTRGLTKGLERIIAKEPTSGSAIAEVPPQRKKRGPKPKPRSPKVYTLKIDQSIVARWKKIGINVESWEDSLPVPDANTRSLVSFSPQLLKRLFGFHDNWKLFGSTELQIQQLLDATPPAVPLAIARAIHSVLTHEHIDINSAGAMDLEPLRTPRPKLPMIPLANRDDPKRAIAEAWRNGILVMKGAIPDPSVVGPDYEDDEDPADDHDRLYAYEDYLADLADQEAMEEARDLAVDPPMDDNLDALEDMDDEACNFIDYQDLYEADTEPTRAEVDG